MKFKFEFACACGDRWSGAVPKKFRTKDFFNYALAEWKKKHGDHVYKIVASGLRLA